MKRFALLLSFLVLSTAAQAQESWWDSILSSIGLGDDTVAEAPAGPNLEGMIDSVTSSLGVSKEQAQGGLAAIFNYAKQNVSEEQFSQLAGQVPGLDSLMQYLPAVSAAKQQGLGGILDMAAEQNESLAQLNGLKKQFDSLGLNMGMVQQYVAQIKAYLDTPEGQQAKEMLSNSLMQLKI